MSNACATDSQDLGPLDSVSLPSEPPDIKNWFSSYIYESPELNTSEGLQDSDGAGDTCSKEEKKGQSGEIGSAGQSVNDFRAAAKESAAGMVKNTELLERGDRKFSIVSGIEEVNFAVRTISSAHSQLSSGAAVAEQMLPWETGNDNHCSLKKPRSAYLWDTDNDKELDCSLIDRTNYGILRDHNLVGSKDGLKESLEKENHFEIVSPGTLAFSVHKGGDSCRWATEISKENDGFISTRNKGTGGNVMPEAGVRPVPNHKKDAYKSSKVLYDKSNFHHPDELEKIGKWHCPQKNKPNHGPPLKQLRLEHWVVRRVKN